MVGPGGEVAGNLNRSAGPEIAPEGGPAAVGEAGEDREELEFLTGIGEEELGAAGHAVGIVEADMGEIAAGTGGVIV